MSCSKELAVQISGIIFTLDIKYIYLHKAKNCKSKLENFSFVLYVLMCSSDISEKYTNDCISEQTYKKNG